MPRFVLLDHSLKGVGGHHFDYALHVLRAADELGYEPVLVSNKRFRGHAKLPPTCRVMPLFRYHTYSKYTIFAGTKHKFASSSGAGQANEPGSLWTWMQALPRRAKDWLNELRFPGWRRDSFCFSFFLSVPDFPPSPVPGMVCT